MPPTTQRTMKSLVRFLVWITTVFPNSPSRNASGQRKKKTKNSKKAKTTGKSSDTVPQSDDKESTQCYQTKEDLPPQGINECCYKTKEDLPPQGINECCYIRRQDVPQSPPILDQTSNHAEHADAQFNEEVANPTVPPSDEDDAETNTEIVPEPQQQLPATKLSTEVTDIKLSVAEDGLTTTAYEAAENDVIRVEKKKGMPDSDDDDDDEMTVLRPILQGKHLEEDVLPYHIDKLPPARVATILHAELDTRENLRSYNSRLKTFVFYQSEVMVSSQLAEAGFVSLKEQDAVACVWCFLMIREFKEYVNPTAIHQLHSHSKCEYLSGLEAMEQQPPDVIVHQYDLGSETLSLATKPGLDLPLVTTAAVGDRFDMADTDQFTEIDKYKVFSTARGVRAVEEVKSIPHHKYYFDCTHESYRFQTFDVCPVISKADARILAANGMQWSEDRIVCVHCAWTWKTAMDDVAPEASEVVSKHLKSASGGVCMIRKGKNVPMILEETCWQGTSSMTSNQDSSKLEHLGVNTNLSKHPDFAVIDRRKATFLTYPYGNGKNGDELSEAGYFYSGDGDCVTCFSCGVESANWSIEEEAWQRHARSSTTCQFIMGMKEPGYISQVVEQHGEYRVPRRENKINNVSTRMLRPRMDSLVVQNCLKAGMERDKVRSAVSKRIQKGEKDFKSTADVVRAVLDLKVPEHALVPSIQLPEVSFIPAAERPPTVPGPPLTLIEDDQLPAEQDQTFGAASDLVLQGAQAMGAAAAEAMDEEVTLPTAKHVDKTVASAEFITNEQPEKDALALLQTPEAFKTITAQLTCKICMTTPVGIVFLPCGHFVCCIACAAAMVQCPICRQNITATVKANFVQQPSSLPASTVSKPTAAISEPTAATLKYPASNSKYPDGASKLSESVSAHMPIHNM